MSQSLDRGLRILDEIAAGRTTLGEMSESLGVHKSTVLRLLVTLQQHHFVHREDAHHYALGRRLFDLAAFALESREVIALARPAMRRLQHAAGHSVYLATYETEEGVVVVVEVAAGRGPFQMAVRVGEALPLHATASGKTLAAALPEDELGAILARAPLQVFTARTIGDAESLNAELAKVTASGFALELAEHEDYINAVAAPVRDSNGRVVAAIALTAPLVSLDARGLTAFTPQLLAACDEVSRGLGWQ